MIAQRWSGLLRLGRGVEPIARSNCFATMAVRGSKRKAVEENVPDNTAVAKKVCVGLMVMDVMKIGSERAWR